MRISAALAAAFWLSGTGVSQAAVTDNMWPTANLGGSCHDRADGTDGTLACQTDNATVTYYMDSGGADKLESDDRSIVSNMLTSQYAPTDLTITYDSTPSFSGASETDIVYQESSTNVASSVNGVTWCNDAADTLRCDQQYIRIRPTHYSPGLSCHETGHAVGLTHGNSASPKLSKTDVRLGCLQTPVEFASSLGANNKENINATY
ncbi:MULTISPECIES: hypothetical protein [unclassified Streptomyces]|uniref:hypothetical protein n=1 Tax=unclassified Streptomyces TaxID=2593676 RepID=UPI00380CF31B